MRKISLSNPSLINNEKTYLDSDYVSTNTTILLSSYTFNTNDIVVIGNPGEKITEGDILQGVTPPNTFILSSALHFNHIKGTPVFKSGWDNFSVEGYSGSIQNWQVLSFGTSPANDFMGNPLVPIQWDKLQSILFHTAGDDTWSYRYRMYNSVLQVFSEYSPTLTGAGFSRQQVGQMILNTRKKIRDVNRVRFNDNDIIALFNDAQVDAVTLVPKLWFLLVDTWESSTRDPYGNILNSGTGLKTTPLVDKYPLSTWSDIDIIDKIKYYYTQPTGGAFLLWDLQPMADIDFDRYLYNQNRFKTDIVLSFKITVDPSAGTSIVIDPMPLNGGGIIYPRYWKNPSTLVEITDKTDFIFPQLLEDYAAWRLHQFMGNDEEAVQYKHLYYGPDSVTPDQKLTGIKLLQKDNNMIRRANGYGRKLWNYRGKRGAGNFFGQGLVNRDFIKENFL